MRSQSRAPVRANMSILAPMGIGWRGRGLWFPSFLQRPPNGTYHPSHRDKGQLTMLCSSRRGRERGQVAVSSLRKLSSGATATPTSVLLSSCKLSDGALPTRAGWRGFLSASGITGVPGDFPVLSERVTGNIGKNFIGKREITLE